MTFCAVNPEELTVENGNYNNERRCKQRSYEATEAQRSSAQPIQKIIKNKYRRTQ
ncbi:MAG: hypothetical protein LBP63_06150 [Prevotellaceae bacterium]|nr:hypothetical protein [Prevotellaceae bacterium]